MSDSKRGSKAAKGCAEPHTPMHFVERYFSGLLRDPESVALDGVLRDVHTFCGGDTGVDAFAELLQHRIAALASQANPLVGDTAGETLIRVKNVMTLLQFTPPELSRDGYSSDATAGLSLVMETAVDALTAASAQLDRGEA